MQTLKLTVILAILILLIGLSGCKTTEQAYKSYILRVSEQKLKAREEKNDLPLSVCDATGSCYVLLRDEYARALKEAAELKIRLIECEKK